MTATTTKTQTIQTPADEAQDGNPRFMSVCPPPCPDVVRICPVRSEKSSPPGNRQKALSGFCPVSSYVVRIRPDSSLFLTNQWLQNPDKPGRNRTPTDETGQGRPRGFDAFTHLTTLYMRGSNKNRTTHARDPPVFHPSSFTLPLPNSQTTVLTSDATGDLQSV